MLPLVRGCVRATEMKLELHPIQTQVVKHNQITGVISACGWIKKGIMCQEVKLLLLYSFLSPTPAYKLTNHIANIQEQKLLIYHKSSLSQDCAFG